MYGVWHVVVRMEVYDDYSVAVLRAREPSNVGLRANAGLRDESNATE